MIHIWDWLGQIVVCGLISCYFQLRIQQEYCTLTSVQIQALESMTIRKIADLPLSTNACFLSQMKNLCELLSWYLSKAITYTQSLILASEKQIFVQFSYTFEGVLLVSSSASLFLVIIIAITIFLMLSYIDIIALSLMVPKRSFKSQSCCWLHDEPSHLGWMHVLPTSPLGYLLSMPPPLG